MTRAPAAMNRNFVLHNTSLEVSSRGFKSHSSSCSTYSELGRICSFKSEIRCTRVWLMLEKKKKNEIATTNKTNQHARQQAQDHTKSILLRPPMLYLLWCSVMGMKFGAKAVQLFFVCLLQMYKKPVFFVTACTCV